MNNYDIFQADLELAQSNDKQASKRILSEFTPLINKYRYIGNIPDEDLLSELNHVALLCIKRFKCDENDLKEFLKEAKELLPGK